MPIAKIQMEDGRIARFEVPDGTTPEQAMQFAADHFSQKGNAAPTRGAFQDATNALESAYTFGISHDIAGAAKAINPLVNNAKDAAFSGAAGIAERLGLPRPNYVPSEQKPGAIGDAYRSGRDESIARMEGFKDRNPVTGFALDVAGGLANPVMQAAGPAPGASLARQSGQGLALGAGAGGAYGFNTTQGDLGDRASGAVQGAVIGGAVGGAAPGVVQGLSRGAQWAADQTVRRVMPTAQADIAARKVAEALVRDGYTPEQAAARLAQMGPEAVLADLGQNSQALAGTISRAPGQGKQAITDFVTGRQEGVRNAANVLQGGQQGRIGGMLDDVTPQRLRQSLDALDAQRQAAAAPLYTEAYSANKSIDSPLLRRIESTPAGERAFAQARAMMQNDMQRLGGVDPELTALAREAGIEGGGAVPKGGVAGGLKLEFWDYVKRALDDQIGAAQRSGANNEARVLTGLKSSLVKELDALDATARTGPNSTRPDGGAYARARQAYSGPSQIMDAVELGNSFMSRAEFANADDLAAQLTRMTSDQRDAFRTGAVQALRDKMGSMVTRADSTKALMDIPGLESKIRLAFGDDQTFRRYIDALRNERQMFNTYGEVTGNSKTAARTAADADLRNDPSGLADAAIGIASNPLNPMNYLRAGVNAVRGAQARLGTPEPARDRMAQLLISRDANALQPNMQAVQMSEARRNAMARALLGGVAANQ